MVFRKSILIIKHRHLFVSLIIAIDLATFFIFPQIIIPVGHPLFFSIIIILILTLCLLYISKQSTRLQQMFGDMVCAIACQEYYTNHKSSLQSSIMVIIPSYNEAKNLEKLLPCLPQKILGKPISVLVVDDGSGDQTQQIIKKNGLEYCHHIINRGQGDALKTGIKIALKSETDMIITMDADGQHNPANIEDLVKPIIEGRADYVSGSRFIGNNIQINTFRHFGIHFFSFVITLLTGKKLTDCTNGFRAIKTDALCQLRLQENRFSAAELLLEASENGLRMVEVPVQILKRHEGKSKKPRGLAYPILFGLALFRVWLRY
jgi:glycosyltransferase involved in cell wall biosynthesis